MTVQRGQLPVFLPFYGEVYDAPPGTGYAVRTPTVAGRETGRATVQETAMPTDLSDVDTSGTELWFSDDVEGKTFVLREKSLFEAAEVRDETDSDVPEFGRWFPVTLLGDDGQRDREGFVVAVGELIEDLQDMQPDPGAVGWTVTRMEKSGPKQTDPYEVNVEPVESPDKKQSSLNS